MRIVKKQICYDDLWSKIPGTVPSIEDSWILSSLYNKCNSSVVQGKRFYNYNEGVRTAIQYNLSEDDLHYEAEFVSYDIDSMKVFPEGNYHAIPTDIIIPEGIASHVTDYTDLYVNIPKSDEKKKGEFYDLNNPKSENDPHYELVNGRFGIYYIDENSNKAEKKELKILSYATLLKWWRFFTKYHRMLDNAQYAKKYTSALDYYDDNTDVGFEGDREEYAAMDALYEARGGKTMYEWMKSNCFLRYSLTDEDIEWKVDSLSFTEAVKWYDWFASRYKKYYGIKTYDECLDTDDCCDCKEYLRLGGEKFFNRLDKWIRELDLSNTSYSLNSATYVIPISLTSSIDDLGEMSIFSSEWDANEDYAPNRMYEDKRQGSNAFGTVVYKPKVKDGLNSKTLYKSYMIHNDKEGRASNCYNEVWFNGDDWEDYTKWYINNNINEFSTSGVTGYTYSPVNGEIIYNPKTEDVVKYYDPILKDFVVINGEICDVVEGKYVELCNPITETNGIASLDFKQNKLLQVFKKGDSKNPLEYCVYKGKKYYLETTSDGKQVVRFFKESSCIDTGCDIKNGKYVIYNGELYLINSDALHLEDKEMYNDGTIFEKIHPILNGYFNVGNDTLYLKKLGEKNYTVVFEDIDNCIFNDSAEGINHITRIEYIFSELSDDILEHFGWERKPVYTNEKIKVYPKYTVNQCNVVSGYSESNLMSLRRSEVNTDDLGNELPGYFYFDVKILSGDYNTVYDGAVLDIPFVEGTVSDLIPFTDTQYTGNYLKSIDIYLVDEKGESLDIQPVSVGNMTMEDAIKKLDMEVFKHYCKGNGCDESNMTDRMSEIYTVMADFEYYIGCTIEYDEENGVYTMMDDGIGVKHIDSVTVNKKIGTYYTDDNNSFTFTYYELLPFRKSVDEEGSVFDSYFEYNTFLFTGDTNDSYSSLKRVVAPDYLEEYNGLVTMPTFRAEWDLYSSTPKIISENIYIDRGVNSAFEKHLKLQEVRSMEALEKYGINYFKIEKR